VSASIVLRPIEPSDREALREGFERLSPASRYRRFFTPMPQLGARDLDYLTDVDHHDHEAIIAVAPDGRIVGVARFVRTGADEAEPAIVVADDCQGQGLGGRLLDALVTRARQEGVVCFRAPVLADNHAAIQALSRLGDTVVRAVGTEVELEILLEPEPTARRRLLGLLRDVAGETLRSGRTLLGEFTPRAPETPALQRRNAIVVALEEGPALGPTVRAAARLAEALGAELDLVAAEWPLRAETEELELALAAGAAALRRRGLSVETQLRRGSPAAALVDVAAERAARLIVVAPPTRAGAARLLPGELADTVARQAPCDVLIARPGRRGTLRVP